MNKPFTASEVRRQASTFGRGRVNNMLRAYADRLEADEKGVPVELDFYDAGLLNDFGGGNVIWWWDYMRDELGRAHSFYQSQVNDIMLAAHPAPADADRLAEALEIIDGWMELYDHQGTGSSRDASRSEKEWAADRAKLSWLLGAQAQKEVE